MYNITQQQRDSAAWYKEFTATMRRKYGRRWLHDLDIPEDILESIFVLHQNALYVLAADSLNEKEKKRQEARECPRQ